MKIMSEREQYSTNHAMWTKKGDEFTTIGDFLGRIPAIELLKPLEGKKVLDAGCGAGFCSRIMARQGAKVYGCDRERTMLNAALQHESENSLGIEYELSDITKLPYADFMFDAVFCVAVLIHDSPEQCHAFFKEALRVLKPGGKIIVSIMHAALYQTGSPNRTKRASWAQYRRLENKSLKVSQRFEEDYYDSKGNVFTSTVWYHPENFLASSLLKAGFDVEMVRSMYVIPDVLVACKQTGEVGYPAFQQVLALKKR